VAVIGVAAVDEKGFLPGLCQRTSTVVEVVLDEDPDSATSTDPEDHTPREGFTMTLPVRVSLV
jgi:hypothetical protein